MASPHTRNKIQSPSQGSHQEPARSLYFIPCLLSPTPSCLPLGTPPASWLLLQQASSFSPPCLSTQGHPPNPRNFLSQHSWRPGSLPDWIQVSALISPLPRSLPWPFFENNPPITNSTLSLLFPVFMFLLCTYHDRSVSWRRQHLTWLWRTGTRLGQGLANYIPWAKPR